MFIFNVIMMEFTLILYLILICTFQSMRVCWTLMPACFHLSQLNYWQIFWVARSIVIEVIGIIPFFYAEILHAKKILEKQISKYMLKNTQIKGYLFTFYAPYAF